MRRRKHRERRPSRYSRVARMTQVRVVIYVEGTEAEIKDFINNLEYQGEFSNVYVMVDDVERTS